MFCGTSCEYQQAITLLLRAAAHRGPTTATDRTISSSSDSSRGAILLISMATCRGAAQLFEAPEINNDPFTDADDRAPPGSIVGLLQRDDSCGCGFGCRRNRFSRPRQSRAKFRTSFRGDIESKTSQSSLASLTRPGEGHLLK